MNRNDLITRRGLSCSLPQIALRFFSVLCALTLIFGFAFPGYANDEEPGVGLVTDENGIADNSWNWLSYQGLLRAQTDLNIVGRLYEPANAAEYETTLQQCANENELCFTVGFLLRDATMSVAGSNPDTAFAILDSAWETYPDNLRGIFFAEEEAGYLAGTLAGSMPETDRIGAIGAIPIPPIENFITGYTNGAQCANDSVEVLVEYAGDFGNPDLGGEIASGMIAQGADIIFAPAGLTGEGAILRTTQTDVWGIGVDTDWYLSVFNNGAVDGSDKLLTSAMKRLDNAVYLTVQDYLNEMFTSGTVRYGLVASGVGLAPFHETDEAIPQSAKDALYAAEAGILDGTLDIWNSCREEPPPELNPIVAASPNHDWVDGYEWPEGSTIYLYIDDDSDLTNGYEYEDTGLIPPGENWINFGLEDKFDLKAGHFITLTDWVTEKVLHVSTLEVTVVNPITGEVSGSADPSSEVRFWIDACGPPCDIGVTPDATGEWSVNFAPEVLVPGEWNSAEQVDADGDRTVVPWRVLDPKFEANITGNWIAANEFPAFTQITVFVYENDLSPVPLFEATETSDNSGHAWFDFWELGLGELEPWNYVEVVGGDYLKDLVVLPLTLDVFDPGTGEISGTAPDGETVRVDACNEIIPDVEWDCRSMEDVVEAEVWSVTFTDFLNPETWFAAFITDIDGDSTMAELAWVPTPYLVAAPIHDWIDAWGWDLGVMLELMIDDPNTSQNPDYTTTTEVVVPDWDPDAAVGMFELGGEYDLKRGDIVTINGDGVEKVHEVIHLYVDMIDISTETVSGTSALLSEVSVSVHDVDGAEMTVFPDEFGNWSADFSWITDLEIGNAGDARQWDDDGDETWIFWRVPNPRIQSWPEIEFVEGLDWPDQALVDLSIEDPVEGELYTDTQTAGPAEWDPNTVWVGFELPEGFDLMPGHIVTMSSGGIIKVHEVTDVAVNGADIETETVFGTASTGVEVLVIPHEDWDKQKLVPIDPPGQWTADFSGESIVTPGSGFAIVQEDDDFDGTWVDWWIPLPIFEVFDGVSAFEFTPNASVTITIYDSEGKLVFGPESRETDDEGNHYSHYTTLGCHFILPGDFVVVTDDVTGLTKALLVSELQIENIDADADVVTGRADPEAVFIVHVDDVNGGFEMEVNTDINGQWTADFGSMGHDVPPAALAHAWLGDEDGDVTMHRLPNHRSPEYVRVLPFLDGTEYTVCPGQAAKIKWGWMEQSEANVQAFLDAIDIHSYVLDNVPLFSSTEESNALFGPIELTSPNAACGWPSTYVSWFDHDLYDLQPGIHSLSSTLHLGQPVPETCGGEEVSGFLWENRTVTLNVVTGANDADADGVDDDIDNCPGIPNRAQADFNLNGQGDKCDEDAIVIWPFLKRNVVVLGRNHPIPVAVLSTPAFDAPSEVDRTSLTFGRSGAEDSLTRCRRYAIDVNHDGMKDLLCNFSSELAGFQPGDSDGILRGHTIDGLPIEAHDAVIVLPPPSQRVFRAYLSGANQVPPVESDAFGYSLLRLNRRSTRLRYSMFTARLKNVTEITLHCAAEGVVGPVGVTLYRGGPSNRRLYWGTITAPDDLNACGWADLDTVVAAMRSGDTYLSVQTIAFPDGEIRGQVRPIRP